MKAKHIRAFPLIIIICLNSLFVIAQPPLPKIGEPCPEILFKNISHFSTATASTDDFVGKPLILDFFSTGCAACFASFPKINELQKEFKNQVHFLLVGREDEYIKDQYEKFRAKLKLELPVVYDSALANKWVTNGYPLTLLIDKKGVVQGITVSHELTPERIEQLIHGDKINLIDKSITDNNETAISYNPSKPLLVHNNGGVDSEFIFRSVLSFWNPKVEQAVSPTFFFKEGEGTYQGTGLILSWLYNLGYVGRTNWILGDSLYGRFWQSPILNIKDHSKFEPDFGTGANLYSYSLILPLKKFDQDTLMKVVRTDLNAVFGYKVKTESREMPCWKLTVLPENKTSFKTRTDVPDIKVQNTGFTLRDQPVKMLLMSIFSYHQDEPPFVDETGITYNIDFSMEAIMTDLDDIRTELLKKGFVLSRAKKLMKVIVIED